MIKSTNLHYFCSRRLRDKLIENERLQLAVEVSTKCGIDTSGVWSAWGMSCLQGGDFIAAREKFSRCLRVYLNIDSLSLFIITNAWHFQGLSLNMCIENMSNRYQMVYEFDFFTFVSITRNVLENLCLEFLE